MKQFNSLLVLLLIATLGSPAFSQHYAYRDSKHDFDSMINNYYLNKDPEVLKKTLAFLDDTDLKFSYDEPHFTGFFGALFSINPKIKNDFSANIDKIKDPDYRQLFLYLLSTNIDSIESTKPLSPAYNDINWSAYFATGDMKYIDYIISNMHYADDRKDKNLFFTGASAKWSLCSNAQQHKEINEYLLKLKSKNPLIAEILSKEPKEIMDWTVATYKEQRANGIW